jgi:photosystem II stability/assembly factor-like uncharacterized protein
MKKLLLSLLALVLLNTANAQWAPQTAPTPSNNLHSVFVLNDTAVAAAGVTGMIRTLNTGLTWTQNVTITNAVYWEVHTKHPTKWYSLGQNTSFMLKVSLGSTSLQGGKPDSILSLNWATQSCASAVGMSGKIETTCDTGATWQIRNSGLTSNLNAVWYSDKDSGCAVGNLGKIVRTKDGGTTWTNITSGTASFLNGIHFPTPTVGFAVGNTGKILKTTDAGLTWSSVPSPTTSNLYAVFFIDKDTGYVGGASGLIMKTITGGTTWTVMATGVTTQINSIHFNKPMNGWAVGNSGTILKYTGAPITTGITSLSPQAQFNFFPNPVGNELTVRTPIKNCSLKIHNAVGSVVHETILVSEESNINTSQLQAGVYFLEFSDGDNSVVKKFIKE